MAKTVKDVMGYHISKGDFGVSDLEGKLSRSLGDEGIRKYVKGRKLKSKLRAANYRNQIADLKK